MSAKLILIVVCSGGVLFSCTAGRQSTLGVTDGRLSPCPSTPNCVSSQSEDPARYVAPLSYDVTAGEALSDLKKLLAGMKRVAIVDESPTYLRAEFRSALFRFVDDAEFLIDDSRKVIHVRSASRVGYSDLGVNRRRVENIRQIWKQRQGRQS